MLLRMLAELLYGMTGKHAGQTLIGTHCAVLARVLAELLSARYAGVL